MAPAARRQRSLSMLVSHIAAGVAMVDAWPHAQFNKQAFAHAAAPAVGSALPFPPVRRTTPAHRAALAELSLEAASASAKASPQLLLLLGSDEFRTRLRACCSRSGVEAWPAERLLEEVREMVYAAELVHNFDGSGHAGVTLEIALYNATQYLPTSWELLRLGYLGDPMNERYGHPKSPGDSAEEGIFRLPRFHGPHDLPADYEEASSRLHYVALNMLGVDVGNPWFGHVAAVFSPTYWHDAVAASPIDTGIFTFCCNATYESLPGALHLPCDEYYVGLMCGRLDETTPGVLGAIDHAILQNQLMWKPHNLLAKAFARWHGDVASNITYHDTITFIESNILGNVLYADRGIKLLVGSFGPLFGSERGWLLRRFAALHGIAMAWAFGPGLSNFTAQGRRPDLSFSSRARLLDVYGEGDAGGLVNVSAAARAAAAAALQRVWAEATTARSRVAELQPAQVAKLWAAAEGAVPPEMLVHLPEPRGCADWTACIGKNLLGDCVCYHDTQASPTFVV